MAADIYVGKNVGITIQVPVEDEDETLKLCTLVENEAVTRGATPDTSDALANSNVYRIVRIGDSQDAVDYVETIDYVLGADRASVDWSPAGSEPAGGATYYVTYYYMNKNQFTVDHTPISDRDMDGVADEVAHVTVKINGSEVTPSSVDDSTGVVTLASTPNAGDEITCSYRYDVNPYVAQELRMELEREIQGIDGLGSDEIQLWALLLKKFGGTIREVFHSKDQLERINPFMLNVFDTVTEQQVERYDGWSIRNQVWDNSKRSWENGKLKVGAGDDLVIYFRRGSEYKDFVAQFKIDWTGSTASNTRIGWFWRYNDSVGGGYGWVKAYVFFIFSDGTTRLYTFYILTGEPTLLAAKGGLSNPADEHTLKIRMQGSNIKIWIDGSLWLHLEDNSYDDATGVGPALKGYAASHPYAYYDDVKIQSVSKDADFGLIVTWDDGQGNVRKIGLDGVKFPSGSLPSPKNEPVFVETPFQAKSGVVIS